MDKKFFRISPELVFPERQRTFLFRKETNLCDSLPLLILKYLGINLISSKRKGDSRGNIAKFLPPVLFHLIYLDTVLTNISAMMRAIDKKLFLSIIVNQSTILLLWYVMLFKKERIKIFLSSIKTLMYIHHSKKRRCCAITDIACAFLLVLPFLYGIAAVYTSAEDHYLMIYFWKVRHITYASYIFFYLSKVGYSIMAHSFVGVVTILYISTCCKIIKSLSKFRQYLENCLSENDSGTISSSDLLSYLNILDHIGHLDEVFTGAAFILTLSNGLSLFTLMAIPFLLKSRILSEYVLLHVTMYLITSGVYLVFVIIIASQVPLEVGRNVKYFVKLKEKFILESPTFRFDGYQKLLIKGIIDRRIVILSGCHIVYFTRHVLITIIGALFTYGLLVMQMQ